MLQKLAFHCHFWWMIIEFRTISSEICLSKWKHKFTKVLIRISLKFHKWFSNFEYYIQLSSNSIFFSIFWFSHHDPQTLKPNPRFFEYLTITTILTCQVTSANLMCMDPNWNSIYFTSDWQMIWLSGRIFLWHRISSMTSCHPGALWFWLKFYWNICLGKHKATH